MSDTLTALHQSDIKSLALLNRGKVRDIYDIDEDHMGRHLEQPGLPGWRQGDPGGYREAQGSDAARRLITP